MKGALQGQQLGTPTDWDTMTNVMPATTEPDNTGVVACGTGGGSAAVGIFRA